MRARARDQRGVAVLEAAFVTPVFFMLILGIAEIGLAMNDYLAVSNAVRAGSREASTTGSDELSDYLILKAVQKESSALQSNKINRIVIYKASAFGEEPTASCQSGTAYAGTGTAKTGACNVYASTDMVRPKTDFGCLSTKNLDRYWCPTGRKITMSNGGTDYVGVWIQYTHAWLSKMFGSTKILDDSAVSRLEPRTQ
jgi:hypothetical protein